MKQFYLITCLFLTGCSERPYVGQYELKKEKEKPTQAPIKEHTFNEEKQFGDIFEKARSGDAQAQLELSVRYWSGGTEEGVFPRNLKKSIQWMSLAAENGNSSAQFELAECYQKGMGLPKNFESAMRWYGKAADQGLARALGKIGDMYFYGLGVPIDYDEAFACYEKGAAHSDFYSANQLASCYNEGLGTNIDLVQAFEGYRKALEFAQKEIENACSPTDEQFREISIIRCNYATCVLFGEGTPMKIETAIVELAQSARNGNYLATLYLGDLAAGGIIEVEKVKSLKIPKNASNVEEPKTGLRAKEIYRLSVGKISDERSSQTKKLNEIGYRTWYGYGIQRDIYGARKLFSEAHDLGDPEGSRNYALTWFEFAWAEQCDEEDRIYAFQILNEAARKGDARAKEVLKSSRWKELASISRSQSPYVGEDFTPTKTGSPFVRRNK